MSYQGVAPILVSMVTAVPTVALGTERIESGEKYVYVYNCGGSTAGVACGMTRPISAFAGMYSGSVSAVSGDMCLGFVKHVAIPSGEYGWALTRGLLTITVASSASDQAAGVKGVGPLGVGACTIAAGMFPVGELTTAIVSGNSGLLRVNLP